MTDDERRRIARTAWWGMIICGVGSIIIAVSLVVFVALRVH
jgi:hypothetical protein